MDRKIEKKQRPLWQWALGVLAIAGVLWFGQAMLSDASIRTYRADASQLIISEVTVGAFEDVTPIRGTILPINSVFLDAVDGGVIEKVLVEEGSFVEAGQPLLQLSNSDLQLRVANNDTQTTEQLNNLNNIANGLENTQLMTERALIDIEYRIKVLERQKSRMEELRANNMISREDFEAVADELAYQRQVRVNTKTRQELEERIRVERMQQIEGQILKLEENLELAMSSFENLLVRAPVSGQLTSLPVEIGESKSRGQRLGQIDVVDEFRIQAQVDEFYVTRVAPGQSARFTLSGQQLQATVTKVYPEITQGTFAVDLEFDGGMPDNVRRGQTLQLELTLGNPAESTLLPLGGFVQDTGGNWVFVLDADQRYATRRDISTGRRNNRFIEVREGLQAGERVITSSYGQMTDVERIELSNL